VPSDEQLASALVAGAAGGAAGTTALNAVTYLDMAVRGRSTSSAPEDSIEPLVSRTGLRIPGEEDTRKNRVAGLGLLNGIFVGVGIGAVLGLARTAGWRPHVLTAGLVTGLGAMAATDSSMAALGVSDPRTWTLMDWLSDVVPHLAYGLATAAVAQALHPD
jgi:hypothetical protein